MPTMNRTSIAWMLWPVPPLKQRAPDRRAADVTRAAVVAIAIVAVEVVAAVREAIAEATVDTVATAAVVDAVAGKNNSMAFPALWNGRPRPHDIYKS